MIENEILMLFTKEELEELLSLTNDSINRIQKCEEQKLFHDKKLKILEEIKFFCYIELYLLKEKKEN